MIPGAGENYAHDVPGSRIGLRRLIARAGFARQAPGIDPSLPEADRRF